MNLKEAQDKLAKYGQEHVLKYYDELSQESKEKLLAEIAATDMSEIEKCHQREALNARGKIEPLGAMELAEIEANKDAFHDAGVKALKEGKVAALLLAGGMGTRLGSDNPKGMYNMGLTRDLYIFECLINNMMDVVKEIGCFFHLFIMTSDKNDKATREFLKEHAYFGYDEKYVHFFVQEMAAACDYNGKIYMEAKDKMATSPNGNGGWYISMNRAGLLELINREGIEYIDLFAVDNVCQRICDPVFVGATILKNVAVGAKVVKKAAPDEKVGCMCLEDGRPSIVEYYDMTEELMNAKDAKGEPAYNFGVILNYMFRVADLANLSPAALTLHVVEKKIPYIDENGELVKPEKPNGYKFETLVLDMIHGLDSCLPYEVVREREFAPVKNKEGVDSVDTARELLKKNGVTL